MNRLSPRYVFAVVVLVVVAAVAFGSVSAAAPSSAPGATGSVVPVEAATLVCPGLSADALAVQSTLLSAGAAPPASNQTPSGTVAAAKVADTVRIDLLGSALSQKPLAMTTNGGRYVRYLLPTGPARTYVVRATGTLAQGLSAQSVSRSKTGPTRSLAAGQCAAPGGEFWFVGGGATAGRTSTVLLTNVDSAPATVDVTIFGAKGPINAEVGQGVLVAPGKQVVVPVDSLSPGEVATAVHVVARSGRFTASMFDAAAKGLTPGGADWVPQSVSPATTVVVPAITGDPGAVRRLSLVVPGPTDGVVRVGVATTDGVLVPTGLDALVVPSGQLVTIDLKEVANRGPFGLLITSDQPVVAGVRVSRGGGATLPDFAYSTGTAAVAMPLVLSQVGASAITKSTLLITSGSSAEVNVQVTVAPGRGPAFPATTVTVPAGRTVAVRLGPGFASPGSLVVSPLPGSGPFYAGVTVNQDGPRGPLMSTWLFFGTPTGVRLPSVRPDPGLAATAAPTG